MRNVIITITFLIIPLLQSAPWVKNLKPLREKSKHLMESVQVFSEGKHSGTMKFAAKTDFLYPGLDERKMNKVKKLWQDFYNCQQALYEATQRLVVPEALAFLEGSNAVLECEVCVSPRDIFNPTQWFYSADYDIKTLSLIPDSSTIYMKNNSLYIYNIGDARGGMYMCKRGSHSARPYVVNIFSKEKTRKVVPEHNRAGPHPATDTALPQLNATLTTVWAEWTQCSSCDYTGTKYRTGICTVVANQYMPGFRAKRKTYLAPAIVKFPAELQTTQATKVSQGITEGQENANVGRQTTNQTASVTIKNLSTSLLETKNLGNVTTEEPSEEILMMSPTTTNLSIKTDLELLDMFEEGIPCRSQLFSEHTRGLKEVSDRSSEVMMAYCKLSCPKSVMFMVVNDKGEVVETANNSEGIFSVKQGLPREFPAISRTVQFATFGKLFKIQCPGNRNGDIPIEWYVGKKILTNTVLEKETHGRIKIDEYNRIIIQPVIYEDSRVFSCWQRQELVGTVRLLVEKEHFILDFQNPASVIGTIVIFVTFSWVYYKAFTLS